MISKNQTGFTVMILGLKFIGNMEAHPVLNFQSSWILLVTSGEPTEDKPDVTFSTPADPNLADHKFEPGRLHSLNPTITNNYELAIRI